VIPVVSTVAMARRAEHAGADAIVAEGVESGGHVGETTTMALLPQIVDAVSIPVIAAGGIAEGRGMAAAMALGAQGIQMGTRFVSSTECIAHPDFKQRIIRASDRATVVAGKSTGHPVRILKNKMARQLLAMEKARASEADLAHFMENTLRRGVLEGDVEHGLLMSGQTAGLVKSVKPVRAIIEDTVSEAEVVLRHLTASSPAVDRHLT
ncbi:MAG: nitronate monooxygenase, partial [Dehalococcoidia bacterium]